MTINVTPRGGGKRAGARVDLGQNTGLIQIGTVAETTPTAGSTPGIAPGGPIAVMGRALLVPPLDDIMISHGRSDTQDEMRQGFGNLSAAVFNPSPTATAARQSRFELRTGRFQGEAGPVWALDAASIVTGAPAVAPRKSAEFATGINLLDPTFVGQFNATEMMGISTPNIPTTLAFSHARTDAIGDVFLTFSNLSAAPVNLPDPLTFNWMAQAPRFQTDDLFAANRGAMFQRSLNVVIPAAAYAAGLAAGLTIPLPEAIIRDVVIASPLAPLPAGLAVSHANVGADVVAIALANISAGVVNAPAISMNIIWGRQQVGLGVS